MLQPFNKAGIIKNIPPDRLLLEGYTSNRLQVADHIKEMSVCFYFISVANDCPETLGK